MERIDDGTQQAAQALHAGHPHAAQAAPTFALTLGQSGLLHAWTELMGQANHAPNPERRTACAQLRDGLATWLDDHGAPSDNPKTILSWLAHDQNPSDLDLLRARLLPLLGHLRAPP